MTVFVSLGGTWQLPLLLRGFDTVVPGGAPMNASFSVVVPVLRIVYL